MSNQFRRSTISSFTDNGMIGPGALNSEEQRRRSMPDLNRLDSSGRVNFLAAVKAVQTEKRLEKVRRARSQRSGLSQGTPLDGGQLPSERTPLREPSSEQDLESVRDEDIEKMPIAHTLRQIILGKGIISACLLAAPFALWAVYHEWSATLIFWLNFMVMVPLAAILGDFTEEVALHTNQTIGGLINASFGCEYNACLECCLCVCA